MNKKIRKALLMVACFALTIGLTIGGTIAWMTTKSAEVVNTFTVGNITIDLDEHVYIEDGKVDEDGNDIGNALDKTADPVKENKNYKMIPGLTMPKDPFVTVDKGSEPCWIFVEITKNSTYNAYLKDYTMYAENGTAMWTLVETSNDGLTRVYRYNAIVNALTAEQTPIYVLGGATNPTGEVTVKDEEVSKTMLDAITAGTTDKPTLTFKAYAIQSGNLTVTDSADIWALIEAEEEKLSSGT